MAEKCRDNIQDSGLVGLPHLEVRPIRTWIPRFSDGATGSLRCLRRTQNRKGGAYQRSGEMAPRLGLDWRDRFPLAAK